MPYPDNFTPTDIDASYQPQIDCPDAYKRLMAAQEAYSKCLLAVTTILQGEKFIAMPIHIFGIMEAVGDLLLDAVDGDIAELREKHYDVSPIPEDHEEMCAAASEQLFDAVRLKPVLYRYDPVASLAYVDPDGSKFSMPDFMRSFDTIFNGKSEGGAA